MKLAAGPNAQTAAAARLANAIEVSTLADVLVGLSELSVAMPNIVSVDVNPLIVVDGAPIAVDALVELSQ